MRSRAWPHSGGGFSPAYSDVAQAKADVLTVIGDHWVVVRSYALHHCDAKQLTKPFFSQRTRERRPCAARLVYARLL
jgi:hypothetical protein